MGAEATVAVTLQCKTTRGKARLEMSALQIRAADVKLDIPFKDMTRVVARDGVLSLDYRDATIALALGAAAAKWADKMVNPPSRLSKLGVKANWRVSAFGSVDRDFLEDLAAAAASVTVDRAAKDSDAIFLFLGRTADLGRIAALTRRLKANGALWIVRPKVHPHLTERGVMSAGRAAGLVDVKVVAFSTTHTAQKFLIPVKSRR